MNTALTSKTEEAVPALEREWTCRCLVARQSAATDRAGMPFEEGEEMRNRIMPGFIKK
jgi:hypothetical protein